MCDNRLLEAPQTCLLLELMFVLFLLVQHTVEVQGLVTV